MRTGEWKSTSITCSTSAGVRSVTRVRFGIAALFTSTSRPPNASHASSATCSARVEVAEIGGPHLRVGRVRAALLEHLVEPVGAPGDDADGRAALGEDRRERGADARRRAGDEDLRALELHRCSSVARRCDSCSAHEKMPFDIVDASSRGPRAEHLGAHRVHALVVGRGLRGELGEVAGEAEVAGGRELARPVGEPGRAAGERGELRARARPAGAGFRCDGSPSYQPP